MKKQIMLLLMWCTAATFAHADWDKSITVNSDNRIRGISQNEAKPGLEFNINKNFNNGLYAGATVPTVSGALGYGFHLDPYGGFKFSPMKDVVVDVGVKNYLFPKVTKYITNEIYSNVTYSIFTLKANRSLSNYFSYPNSNGTTYYELLATLPVSSNVSAYASTGKLSIVNNELFNYTTNQVGIKYQYSPNWQVTGSYIENRHLTDIAKEFGYVENGSKLYKNTLVISLKRTF